MRWLLMMVLTIACSVQAAFAQSSKPSTVPATATPAALVELHGVIDEYSSDLLIKRFNQAKQQGAKTIIVELNTPGGLVRSALDLTRFLRSQSDVHTIAY